MNFKWADDLAEKPEKMPREKLGEKGPRALAAWELVAILLRTGVRTKNHTENVVALAKRLVAEYGLKGLFSQNDAAKLKSDAGIFATHASAIVAAGEIFRRAQKSHEFDASSPEKIAKNFEFLKKSRREECHLLLLDDDRRAFFSEIIGLGNADDEMTILPRDVLTAPLALGARAFAIVHSHPRGAATPSEADILWTAKIADISQKLFGILFCEHLIIGKNDFFSFSEKGLL